MPHPPSLTPEVLPHGLLPSVQLTGSSVHPTDIFTYLASREAFNRSLGLPN